MISPKYKNIYDRFIEFYKTTHINPWHEINETELNRLYDELTNSMDIGDGYNFKYFMDYIIKRLNGETDAHTHYYSISIIPINFRIFENVILVNYPEPLKGAKLLSINGINIDDIIKEIDNVITYGTKGKRIYELEKSLFNRNILFGLPSLRNSDKLDFEVESINGEKRIITFEKSTKYTNNQLFDYDEYRYGKNTSYRLIDNCLIYNHSSVQMRFKEDIEQAINNLRKENIDEIDTIIIDLRGNTGGNSSLNRILIDYLEEHKDKKLICLTDYRVFSGGRYALRDLINLGAITIGEEISTPINCYGNSNWVDIDGHNFMVSECYFHPTLGWSASSKEEYNREVTDELIKPYIFKPDILIEQTKEDYVQGIDTILNYALEYSKTMSLKK